LLDQDDPLTAPSRPNSRRSTPRATCLPRSHLKPVVDPEDAELSALLNDNHRAEPPRQRSYEHRKRPLSERHAPVEHHRPKVDEDEGE
jgi:hypothetical protein